MRILGQAALAIAFVVSGPAVAQAQSFASGPADMNFDFSGFYAGVEIGGTSVGSEYSSFFENTSSGALVDVVAGYNFVNDSLLLGIEADAGYSTTHFSEPCYDRTCEGRFGAMGSVRARIGYVVNNLLFYVTGGGAAVDVYGARNDVGITDSEEQLRIGLTVGGGVEAALTDTLTGRVQFQYTDLGTRVMTLDAPYAVKLNQSTIKLGLLNHFN